MQVNLLFERSSLWILSLLPEVKAFPKTSSALFFSKLCDNTSDYIEEDISSSTGLSICIRLSNAIILCPRSFCDKFRETMLSLYLIPFTICSNPSCDNPLSDKSTICICGLISSNSPSIIDPLVPILQKNYFSIELLVFVFVAICVCHVYWNYTLLLLQELKQILCTFTWDLVTAKFNMNYRSIH